MGKTSGVFRFRRGDNLGSADAEHDRQFLDTCFVDNGDLSQLLNCDNPRCIIVGRTGAGKSALLLELEKRQAGHTERIDPENLSLNYIANSDTVKVLSDLEINLDPFFRLLWRHVIAITIFQHISPITESAQKTDFLTWVYHLIRNDKTTKEKRARHQRVVEFLNKYSGAEFWGDFSERVQGIVVKFEEEFQKQSGRDINLSVGTEDIPLKAGIDDKNSRSEKVLASKETTVEPTRRFQRIVNAMHVAELSGILDLVSEVMEDSGRNIYIVIDTLDLKWADESVRFDLIRALIDTVIAFSGVANSKIVVAMRLDLLNNPALKPERLALKKKLACL